MQLNRLATASVAALLVAGAATTWSSASAMQSQTRNGEESSYLVLADKGASAKDLAARLKAEGAQVTSVNQDIGVVMVKSDASDFRRQAGALKDVKGVAADRTIGQVDVRNVADIERENLAQVKAGKSKGALGAAKTDAATTEGDPLDSKLWGMRMIGADKAHGIDMGSKRVRVGVIDTGIQADHPDLHANFDYKLSRNFTTDMPEIDGPCEVDSCVDPATVDEGGHGSHVAGTIAAAMNGFGLSGVAPEVDLVNVRAGQDSGYFFAGPTVNALTYAGDAGLDVVNMSFYVDPWLYNCQGGAPEDSPEQAADQDTIIAAVTRALNYAHSKGVTLVAAAGNNHEDMSNPRTDLSSPDFGADPYPRTIDNDTCWDLPVEGPHVIGVTALGPTYAKADFSNYTSQPRSGEIEVSAPGGYFRDGFGTSSFRTNENMILSSVPLISVQETGEVDADGNVTPIGEASGVIKQCQADPEPGTAECGYYAYYQGTSMASPHATGVAALIVSAHGKGAGAATYGLAPDTTRKLMLKGATDRACPSPRTVSYANEGRSAEFDATCVGSKSLNGFYGQGVVNALAAVK